jgi:AcrR family transcriptional regulator
MSIVVEHEKRKREILEKALDVFLEEGYAGASYQKIADRCGIARTILYNYFRNKQEIFRYTIKQVTEGLEKSFKPIIEAKGTSNSERLLLVFKAVIGVCVSEKKLFSVVLEYLLNSRNRQETPDDLVRRRVIKLRMIVTGILMDGMKSGEFRKINARGINEAYYSIIEATVVRLVIMKQESVDDSIEAVASLIESVQA